MAPRVVIAGVLALDDLKTPYKECKGIIGGAGIYSSVAASIFSETALVAAIGSDFPADIMKRIKSRGINVQSVKKLDYPTFHWAGEYRDDMAQAITHETNFQINEYYDWEKSKEQRKIRTILLCNNDPIIQAKLLRQVQAEIVAMDTMNLWIDIRRNELNTVVSQVDILFINDAEARLYSNLENLDDAAHKLLKMGPKYIIIKKGEKGASFYSETYICHRPAYVVDKFVDPTGAGDSFAGAVIGYLANLDKINKENIITAMNYGAAVASITVEGFGTESIMNITKSKIDARFRSLIGGPGRI